MAKFKPLKASDVEFSVQVEMDECPVRGNLVCSDDPGQDAKDEQDVIDRLNRGDETAWCRVCVTAKDADGNEGSDSLGGVNMEPGLYGTRLEARLRECFPDLWDEALSDLNRNRRQQAVTAQARTVVDRAKVWKRQGARSKWSTGPSRDLWDALDCLEKLEAWS